MSDCSVCWGTGYHKGFGAHCSAGCKPPKVSAPTSPMARGPAPWTSTVGPPQPLSGNRVFTDMTKLPSGPQIAYKPSTQPGDLYFTPPRVERFGSGPRDFVIKTELKNDAVKADNWGVAWRYAVSFTLGQGINFEFLPLHNFGSCKRRQFFISDANRANAVVFESAIDLEAMRLIELLTGKSDLTAADLLSQMIRQGWPKP